MRADARRNRELIITAALQVFAERCTDASMEDIARAAGLGVGTLYRHFPDRRALVESMALDTLHDLLAFTRAELTALGGPTGPTGAFSTLQRIIEYCQGLPLALIKTLTGGASTDPRITALVSELDDLFADIAARAQMEGSMRSDIPPAAVVGLLNVVVCRPGARADDHLTTVMLDGLAARTGDDQPPVAAAPVAADAPASAARR
jgi:AcrR family transcriptional regulator